MKIQSTRPAFKNSSRHSPGLRSDRKVLDGVQDTFHRGYVNTMMCLPGAVRGGAFGAAIGWMNALPLAPFYGFKPAVLSALVLGAVGGIAGGALSHSLLRMD